MSKWYVKEIAKLTGVSVQTLHYYDKVNLLKPTLRAPNGYRLYSEQDLVKLQQIVALKFFGLELKAIKSILAKPDDGIQALEKQANTLEQKAKSFSSISQRLKTIILDAQSTKSIPWEKLVNSIEVFKMAEELENNWVKEIFTEQELSDYADFEREHRQNTNHTQIENKEQAWHHIVDEIKANLAEDPYSPMGICLGEKVMNWVNNIYGPKYAHLRTKKFEKGFAEGKGLEEAGLTTEVVAWMDKAMDAYWRHRIFAFCDELDASLSGNASEKELKRLTKHWQMILDDMYGEQEERKSELLPAILAEDKISPQTKTWFRAFFEV